MTKPTELPPIDERVMEEPPREELCRRFSPRPLSPSKRKSNQRKKIKVRVISEGRYRMLRDGKAAVAWVTDTEYHEEGGYEAGPSYSVNYAFDADDGTRRTGFCQGAFDALHLGYGGHSEWSGFLAGCCNGRVTAFTVLYDDTASAPVAYLLS